MVKFQKYKISGKECDLIAESMEWNHLKLKNRLLMPPMAAVKSAGGGLVIRELFDYYREQTFHSHISLILTKHSYVTIQEKAGDNQLSMASGDVLENM